MTFSQIINGKFSKTFYKLTLNDGQEHEAWEAEQEPVKVLKEHVSFFS